MADRRLAPEHVAAAVAPPECPAVMVFAPAPLLTVTIERGARTPEIHVHAGGQGYWVARLVARLGARAVLCGSFGGELGPTVRQLIERSGIEVVPTDTAAPTGSYVHDRRTGDRIEVASMPCGALDRHDVDDLYGAALAAGISADVTVLTGPSGDVVPDDIYRRLAADLGSNGCRVVADLSGGRLHAALDGGLYLVKVSDDELRADGELTPPDEIAQALDALQHRGAQHVVVSCAERGAFALLDGSLIRVRTPTFEPSDTRGAGDSMTATIAAVIAGGSSLEEALLMGAAAGALNVTRHGLGSGVIEQVRSIARTVHVDETWPGDDCVPGPQG